MLFDSKKKLLLGMVHLPPLPGSPGAAGHPPGDVLAAAIESARRDAAAIVEGGMDGIIIENFGDAPFFPDRVPPIVVASMASIATRLREDLETRIGVNVLRNDARAALSIAAATGLDFIRVNVHCGAMVTDQGIVEGRAHETLRERSRLGARVAILADVLVKHAAPIGGESDVADLARETVGRGGADALIVTGPATGAVAEVERLRRVREAVPGTPILVGSGIAADTVDAYADLADGFIVGTALKRDGDVLAPVETARVRALVDRVRSR